MTKKRQQNLHEADDLESPSHAPPKDAKKHDREFFAVAMVGSFAARSGMQSALTSFSQLASALDSSPESDSSPEPDGFDAESWE